MALAEDLFGGDNFFDPYMEGSDNNVGGSSYMPWDPQTFGSTFGDWNNSVLSDLGFEGQATQNYGTGEDPNWQFSPEYQQWAKDNGYRYLTGSVPYKGLGAGFFNKDNNLVDGTWRTWRDNPGPLWDLAVSGAAGAATGGLGAGLGFSGIPASMISGAAGGALGAGLTGADPLRGAIAGGLGGGLNKFNPAGQLGITNQELGNVVNRAAAGGVGALATGNDPLKGALTSAAGAAGPQGLSYAANTLNDIVSSGGNMNFYDGTTGDSAFNFGSTPINTGGAYNSPLNNFTDQSYAPYQQQSIPGLEVNNPAPQPTGASFAPPDFFMQAPQQQQNPMREAIKNVLGFAGNFSKTGNIGQGVANLAGGLAGIYDAYQRKKNYGGLAQNLSSMYGPNSAYAQQLRQQLMRQDAASGRRSQYGPREVELQARLAEMNSRNAPTLANIYGHQGNATSDILKSGIGLISNLNPKIWESILNG